MPLAVSGMQSMFVVWNCFWWVWHRAQVHWLSIRNIMGWLPAGEVFLCHVSFEQFVWDHLHLRYTSTTDCGCNNKDLLSQLRKLKSGVSVLSGLASLKPSALGWQMACLYVLTCPSLACALLPFISRSVQMTSNLFLSLTLLFLSFFFSFFFLFCFWDKVSLYSFGLSEAHDIDQAGIEHIEIHLLLFPRGGIKGMHPRPQSFSWKAIS